MPQTHDSCAHYASMRSAPVADFMRCGLPDVVQGKLAARQRANVEHHAVQLGLADIVPRECRVPGKYQAIVDYAKPCLHVLGLAMAPCWYGT